MQRIKAIFYKRNTLYIHKEYKIYKLKSTDIILRVLVKKWRNCMAVGAKDFIDRMLVEKYSQEKVDNHDENGLVSRISASDMLDAMNDTANHYKNMLMLNQRLSMVCYGVVAKSAKYIISDEEAI